MGSDHRKSMLGLLWKTTNILMEKKGKHEEMDWINPKQRTVMAEDVTGFTTDLPLTTIYILINNSVNFSPYSLVLTDMYM